MKLVNRQLLVTGMCILSTALMVQIASASTRLRVHLQGSPNINSVTITLINLNGPKPPFTLDPGQYTPNPGIFLSNGSWVAVAFDQNTQEVIAVESFVVTQDDDPTVNARIFQEPSSQKLRWSWGALKVVDSYKAAAAKVTDSAASKSAE